MLRFIRISGLSCTAAIALLAVHSGANAVVVSQTVDLSGQTLINTTTVSANSPAPIGAIFDKFNSTLGTLTAVSFDYDYDFNIAMSYGANGGSANGTVGGPFVVNGVSGSGNGNGGNNGGSPFTVATTPFSVTSTFDVAGDLSGFASPTPGPTNTFLYDALVFLNYNSGGGTGSLNLLDTSSVKVNYTYTPIPEPASLGLLAVGAAATMLRRRRA